MVQNVSSESSTNTQYGVDLPLNTTRTLSYYKVLNVCPTATTATIKDAYHTLIKQYHPDKQRNHQNHHHHAADSYCHHSDKLIGSNKDFIQIQTAWECLRESKSRSMYDYQLQTTQQQYKLRHRQRQQNSIPITIDECRQEYHSLIETDDDNDVDDNNNDDTDANDIQYVNPRKFRSEMILVVVDYIYQCRCGHDLHVAQQQQQQEQPQHLLHENSKLDTEQPQMVLLPPSSDNSFGDDDENGFELDLDLEDENMYLRHCVGCSVIYDIRPVFQ